MNLKKILFSSTLIFVLIGCTDKAKEDTHKVTKKDIVTSSTSSPKIEIVENENPQEIKVEQKEQKNYSKDGKNYYFSYGINSEYDPKSQPANDDASVRVKPRTQLEANMQIRSPYEEVQISLLVKKLSKKFIVKCSACHNDYANGIIGPSLLNKTPEDILKKINDFKTGVKANPLMDDLIKLMSDDEIKQLANEIFEFNNMIKKLKK
jgi:cytochrome c553